MRRRIWLMATVTVLFGLQVPICALACLPESEARSSTAEPAPHPCHEQSSDAPTSEAPRSHDDCGCEVAAEALLPGGVTASSLDALSVTRPSASWRPLDPSARLTFPTSIDTDLPPPDILLLKSTLII